MAGGSSTTRCHASTEMWNERTQDRLAHFPAPARPPRWAPARVDPAPGSCGLRYFTKYQFSGLMDSVDDCGRAPLRLFAISVSWKAGSGCHSCASCADR